MTTSDHSWTRLRGNCLSIRGDVRRFQMATTDVHFLPERSPDPKIFEAEKHAPDPSGDGRTQELGPH